jgi:hypothetical protein
MLLHLRFSDEDWRRISRGSKISIRYCGSDAKCDVCGNDYDKSFQIISAGKTRTFDSFECAIHMLAPTCPHCNCKVVGHGVEAGGQIYCCVHCAEESGAHGLKDRS